MKIVCPQCRTAYELTPAALGSAGRTVRCARCQTQWFAEAPKPAPARPRPTFAPVGPRPVAGASDVSANASVDVVAVADPAPAAATPQMAPPPQVIPAPPAAPVEVVPAAVLSPAGPAIEGQAVVALPEAETDAATAEATAAVAAAEAAQAKADIESIAARRASKRRPTRKPAKASWGVSRIAALVAALVAIDAGLVIWRAEVVRVLPQTASLFERIGLPVNLRDLTFKDIRTSYDENDGVNILVVDGTIVATGRAVVDVPRLRFAIQAANGHEIYAWTALPSRTKLAPGETLPFKSRLASPPEQGRSVKVRFFNRQDIASGLR